MRVKLIFVQEPDSLLDEQPWLKDAWDEYTIESNPSGFTDSLKATISHHGGENVRVAEIDIKGFDPSDLFVDAQDRSGGSRCYRELARSLCSPMPGHSTSSEHSTALPNRPSSLRWFLVWHDGLVNQFSGRTTANVMKFEKSVEVASSHPAVTEVFVAEKNKGVAIQQYEAYQHMALHSYRFVTFLDNDVVLSPHYMRITEMMIPYMLSDDRLFSVSPTFMRTVAADRIDYHLDTIEYGSFNWIGYTMDMLKWPEVAGHFDCYWQVIKNVDYGNRPHQLIRTMINGKGWDKPHTSQDCAKDMALRLAGMRRLRCSVNRGFYIGEDGVHGTPGLYQRQGWADQVPYIHPIDAEITSLRWRDDGHTDIVVRTKNTRSRRDMNATDFFHRVIKPYVEPRAYGRCLSEIKSIWPEVERDAAKVGKDVRTDDELRDELAKASEAITTQARFIREKEETIASLTQQLEAALERSKSVLGISDDKASDEAPSGD